MSTLKTFWFFLMMLIIPHGFAVSDTCLKMTEAEWNKMVKNKDYNETYQDFDTSDVKKAGHLNGKIPSMDLGGFKYIFYALVAGAILFLVVKILQNINSSPAIHLDSGITYSLSEVEDKLLEIDLDKIFNEALLAKDYRLALRINFLIIIKLLSMNNKISWTKEKTNWEYYEEIKDQSIALKFKQIVTPFETIWYGEHELTETQFNRLQPSYESFKTLLK